MEFLSEGEGAIRDSLSTREIEKAAAFALAAKKNAGKPAGSKNSYFADYDPKRGGWFVNSTVIREDAAWILGGEPVDYRPDQIRCYVCSRKRTRARKRTGAGSELERRIAGAACGQCARHYQTLAWRRMGSEPQCPFSH